MNIENYGFAYIQQRISSNLSTMDVLHHMARSFCAFGGRFIVKATFDELLKIKVISSTKGRRQIIEAWNRVWCLILKWHV